MPKAKTKPPARTETEIRHLVLSYFYDRYRNARSERSDKTGVAGKISIVKRGLKDRHGLKQQEVQRALTYLMDQGWVSKEEEQKSFNTPQGTTIPSVTPFYRISAAGIDKIEGTGEFTPEQFHGIKIDATGQNIITVGDGNQVDARYEGVGIELAGFADAVRKAEDVSEADKLAVIADLQTIQNQLVKPEPSRSIVRSAWETIEKVVTGTSLAANFATVAGFLVPLL